MAKENDTTEVTVDVSDIPADRPEDATLAVNIEAAANLIDEKAVVLEKLQKVRILCSLLTENTGSPEQVAWVRTHLPRKERKAKSADA